MRKEPEKARKIAQPLAQVRAFFAHCSANPAYKNNILIWKGESTAKEAPGAGT